MWGLPLLVYLDHVEDLPSGPSLTSVAQAMYPHVMLQVSSGPYYSQTLSPVFHVVLLFYAAYQSSIDQYGGTHRSSTFGLIL